MQTVDKPAKHNWLERRMQKVRMRKTEEAAGMEDDVLQRLRSLQEETMPLLSELSELRDALCILGDNPEETYCVFEKYLRERVDTRLWWEHWRLPDFGEYRERIWVEELMRYATRDSFLVLGYAPCIGDVLYKYATGMRSVCWILKPEQYTDAVQQFIDSFYEEFGLAISLQLLEPGEDWAGLRAVSTIPVNVLDFSREEKISAHDVAAGSIWLDVDAMEGKERRIESRCPKIAYFSLKKLWSHLDTIGKNRYNT